MKIEANGIGQNASVNGVKIKMGTHNYPFDPRDPMTAIQLEALKEVGLIRYDEVIPKEILEDATEALNKGEMKLEVKKVMVKVGKSKKLKPHNLLQKSETPKAKKLADAKAAVVKEADKKAKKVEEEKKNAGSNSKPASRAGKDND